MLNPDHDALNSFVRNDVKNGATVFLGETPSVAYSWQDGKVIDKDGKVIMDCGVVKQTDTTQPK